MLHGAGVLSLFPREEFCRISTVAGFMPFSPANMPCDKKGHSLERRRAFVLCPSVMIP